MNRTKIEQLNEFGQSVWLDNISRRLIDSERFKQMLAQGLRGMTSNPTIFDKAISQTDDYDEKIRQMCELRKSAFEIYDDLTIRDIQDAADIFRPIYESTNGLDGYVSLEINPQLALKAGPTVVEGRRLFEKVNRPNVMFKVPATSAGFVAIEELLGSGINVNITLIFSLEQYIETTQAFLKGLKQLAQQKGDLSKVCSVASVFVSRIDTTVDRMLDERIAQNSETLVKDKIDALKGKAAVANSKIIYQKYLEIFAGKEFQQLKQKGAKIQRVLWASTSTKNPVYSDIKYVTELIAQDTVNTMPEATFSAFLEHGEIKEALTSDIRDTLTILDDLQALRIDVNKVCAQLLDAGVAAFEKSFLSLLDTIEKKGKILCKK
jgi:transaldolase